MTRESEKHHSCPRCGHYISRCLCDGSFHCQSCGYWVLPDKEKKK